jgi:hypothetical protein
MPPLRLKRMGLREQIIKKEKGGIGDVHENIKIILKFIFSCTSLRFPL